MSKRLAALRLALRRFLLAFLLMTGACSPASAMEDDCAFVDSVALNTTSHRTPSPLDGIDRFRLTIPSDGVLVLYTSTADTESSQPRLAFLGDSCTGGGGYTVIHQTPAGLVLQVSEGSHFAVVSAEGPDQSLFLYKLRTAFVAEPIWPDQRIQLSHKTPANCTNESPAEVYPQSCDGACFIEFQQPSAWTKDVDPIDDDDVPGGGFLEPDGWTKDVDPIDDDDVPGGGFAEPDWWTKDVDPIDDDDVPGGGFTGPGIVLLETTDPLNATLYTGTECKQENRLAEGLLSSAPIATTVPAGDFRLTLRSAESMYRVGLKFFPICGLGEVDDHFDIPLCGTPLTIGTAAVGTLDSVTDDDFFELQLPSQQTVTILVRSIDPATIELYDERGQRLESQTCSGDCTMHIVRTLGPGHFDLRVTSAGSWGSLYSVEAAVLDSKYPEAR